MDMKTYRFGVLGAGSMGKTIAAGAVRAGLFRPDEVLLFNRSEEKRAANRAEGYAVTGDFTEVYTACDTVLLSVKPQNFAEVLPQLAECKCDKPLVLSIAAGISFAKIEAALGADTRSCSAWARRSWSGMPPRAKSSSPPCAACSTRWA